MLTVQEHVEYCLKDHLAPLWWPGLAERLEQEAGTPSDGYSTSQWLVSAPPSKIWKITSLGAVDFEFSIELLSAPAVQRLSSKDVPFAEEVTITTRALHGLDSALTKLQQVPSLAATVSSLAKSVHILEAPEPGFDVSYSDPSIPFSVFLNVSEGRFADLRTAEALVHEAMHLQLSLIERFVPIAKSDEGLHYSPWKRSQRPVSGVMHAFYVFRVIDQWLACLSQISDEAVEYAQKRRKEICDEIQQLSPTSLADHLTAEGHQLLSRLLG